MNACSKGIAVDGQGPGLGRHASQRQLKKEEEVTDLDDEQSAGLEASTTSPSRPPATPKLRTTDAFKLEIFAEDGVLLGDISLTHFVDVIRTAGDQLFLIDRERGVTVYQYRIVEK